MSSIFVRNPAAGKCLRHHDGACQSCAVCGLLGAPTLVFDEREDVVIIQVLLGAHDILIWVGCFSILDKFRELIATCNVRRSMIYEGSLVLEL